MDRLSDTRLTIFPFHWVLSFAFLGLSWMIEVMWEHNTAVLAYNHLKNGSCYLKLLTQLIDVQPWYSEDTLTSLIRYFVHMIHLWFFYCIRVCMVHLFILNLFSLKIVSMSFIVTLRQNQVEYMKSPNGYYWTVVNGLQATEGSQLDYMNKSLLVV